jgi:BON domain
MSPRGNAFSGSHLHLQKRHEASKMYLQRGPTGGPCLETRMKTNSLFTSSIALAMVLGLGAACAKKPDDAKISSDVQARFSQDSGLSTKQLTVQASNGVVTIAGAVDNDVQREAAGRQAASVEGVKTVINNLQVGNAPAAAVTQPPTKQAPPNQAKTTTQASNTPLANGKPAAGRKSHKSGDDGKPMVQDPASTNATSAADVTAAAQPASDVAPADNTPPPPPSPRRLIIDQGTQITVRLIDPIDSEKNQTGDTFHATLNAALTSDGEQAVPAGVELTGHLVEVKSAGKFAGQSTVAMQLDSLSSGGKTYSLETDQYRKNGSSRGKNTAEKVGGGAIIGGIIGAIAGGGKGAAIGSAAGAGVGGGVQAATKAQQIKLPSETVLNFTLQAPIEVVQAPSPDANRPKLPDAQQ